MKPADIELSLLRRQEKTTDLLNRVADLVVYQLVPEVIIDNAVLGRVYRSAIGKFGNEMPPDQIRAVCDGVVVKEVLERQRFDELRKARSTAKRKRAA